MGGSSPGVAGSQSPSPRGHHKAGSPCCPRNGRNQASTASPRQGRPAPRPARDPSWPCLQEPGGGLGAAALPAVLPQDPTRPRAPGGLPARTVTAILIYLGHRSARSRTSSSGEPLPPRACVLRVPARACVFLGSRPSHGPPGSSWRGFHKQRGLCVTPARVRLCPL